MRNTVIWSFLSVALASGALMVGCDGDAKVVKSGEDESCVQTSDCSDGLKCFNNICFKTSTGSGNQGGEGTGATGSGPPGFVLGSDGESCTKRADCEEGLGCFNQRCVMDAGGVGGANPGGVVLGEVGETCGLTSDCGPGLACLPQDDSFRGIELKAGSNSIGVCSRTDSGLAPTGNACGAECLTADDCCELPIELHVPYSAIPFTQGYLYGTGVNSCAELASVLTDVNCAAAVLSASDAARCFAQTTYCDCAAKTWSCTNDRCVYDAACSADGSSPGGCPSFSRLGHRLVSTCDTLGAEKCTLPVVTTACKADADCLGEPVADGVLESCTADECTCYKPTGLCYRKCSENLDCPVNPPFPMDPSLRTVCDAKANVCVPADACSSDAGCAATMRDFRYKCLEGTCEIECSTDLDCNFSLTNGYLESVCNANKRCEQIGCTADDECPGFNGLARFCAPKATGVAGVTVYSATTD